VSHLLITASINKRPLLQVGEVLLDIALKGGVQSLSSEFKLEGVLNTDKQAIAQIVRHPQV
jgi:hypothetical protein